MKKSFFILLGTFAMTLMAFANEIPNGDHNHKGINLGQTIPPDPHAYDLVPPLAEYNTVTEELTITLDPVYYSEYTITLVSDLIEVDYYPFSSVVCLPTSSMSDVVDIYIESDDCGCYAGVLDKDAVCGTMGE